jgi:hypothetical protein
MMQLHEAVGIWCSEPLELSQAKELLVNHKLQVLPRIGR